MKEAGAPFESAAPVAWLLEGPAFVRYRTLVEVLDCPPEDDQARQARAAIVREPEVERLLSERNDAGYWGTRRKN